jgi:hypothetical protein
MLENVDAIFDRWLALPPIGRPPSYQHRQAALALSHGPSAAYDPLTLIAEALDQIERTWAAIRAKCGERAAGC